MADNNEKSSNSGCILAVVSVIVFISVGIFVSDASNVFVGAWAGFFAAILVYFIGAKL